MAALDQKLTDDLGNLLRRALAWWTGELASLLPRSGRSATRAAEPAIVITLNDGRLALSRDQRNSLASGAVPLSEDVLLERLAKAQRGRRRLQFRLRLPYRSCLVRRVAVPERAIADAPRILALDLERATPFAASEVYTAHVRDDTRSEHGAASFLHVIVKRSTVDAGLDRLRATGADPDRVDCWSEDGTSALPVDFLASPALAAPGPQSTSATAKVFAILAAVLAAAALAQSFASHRTALAEIQAETAAIRARLKKAESTRGAIEASLSGTAAVRAAKQSRPASAEVIENLTRLLPDDAYLTELNLDGPTLSISGFAVSASSLVPLLERSDAFTDASVLSPVTFDTERGKERFSFRLRLRMAEPVAADGPATTAPALENAERALEKEVP